MEELLYHKTNKNNLPNIEKKEQSERIANMQGNKMQYYAFQKELMEFF